MDDLGCRCQARFGLVKGLGGLNAIRTGGVGSHGSSCSELIWVDLHLSGDTFSWKIKVKILPVATDCHRFPYSSMNSWFSKHQEWLSDGKNRSWKLLGWRHSSLGRGGAKFPFGTNAVDELWNTWAVGQSIVPWPSDFQGSRGVGELLRNIEHVYKGRWEEFWFFRHLLERIWNQWQPKLKLWKGLSSNSAQRLLVICHILKSMAWGIEKHAASLAHYVSLDLDPPTGANLLANSITSPGAQVSYHDHSRSLKWNPDSWNMLEPKLCASHTQPTGFYKRSTNTDHSRLVTTGNIGKPRHKSCHPSWITGLDNLDATIFSGVWRAWTTSHRTFAPAWALVWAILCQEAGVGRWVLFSRSTRYGEISTENDLFKDLWSGYLVVSRSVWKILEIFHRKEWFQFTLG